MIADYLMGIGSCIAAVAASASVYVTYLGNKRTQQVQAHLDGQDHVLGIRDQVIDIEQKAAE